MRRQSFFILICVMAIVCAVLIWSDTSTLTGPAIASAQEDWKQEFEDVCSKTQDAMTFTADEVKALIARCDKLKPIIEKLGETQRKVYGKRLQLCRDLFVFVLESKEKK